MTIHGWKTKFNEIRREFGYSEKEDLISAKKLNLLLKRKNSKKEFQNIIKGKTVFVIGAGPSLSKSLKYIMKSKNNVKIVADGAVRALLEKNIRPDILVTDLDGDMESIKKIGKTRIPIIVHAHGNNSNRLEIVKEFLNVSGTTQTRKFGKLENYGGFTDGDRCVFLAEYFNASKIVLIGMDFGQKIGKYSKRRVIDRRTKIKKLKSGKMIIEWFATKSKADLYSTKRMKGYKTIRLIDLECIENF